MRSQARMVVESGMIDVGLPYHLAQEGWSDVIAIKKGELIAPRPWHAGGKCPHFNSLQNLQKAHPSGVPLCPKPAPLTGHAVARDGRGGLRLATSAGAITAAAVHHHTLGRPFAHNIERIFVHYRVLFGHAGSAPNRGNYFLNKMAGESVRLVRGQDGEARGFIKVCGNRGSQISKTPMALVSIQPRCAGGPHYDRQDRMVFAGDGLA